MEIHTLETPKPETATKEEGMKTIKKLEEIVENYGDRLNLQEDLSLTINTLFQEKLLTEKEANFLVRELHKSEGKDNYTTERIIKILNRINLYKE